MCQCVEECRLFGVCAVLASAYRHGGGGNLMNERNDKGSIAAEKALELNRLRFEALYELSQMADKPVKEIKDFALEASLSITGSKVGYIYFLSEDETELSLHAWSRSVVDECGMPARQTVFKVADTGLWGEAARLRRPVITNDYAAPDPRKKGVPPGHVPIRRHMNIPLVDDGRIVLMSTTRLPLRATRRRSRTSPSQPRRAARRASTPGALPSRRRPAANRRTAVGWFSKLAT